MNQEITPEIMQSIMDNLYLEMHENPKVIAELLINAYFCQDTTEINIAIESLVNLQNQ